MVTEHDQALSYRLRRVPMFGDEWFRFEYLRWRLRDDQFPNLFLRPRRFEAGPARRFLRYWQYGTELACRQTPSVPSYMCPEHAGGIAWCWANL